jgi:Fe-S oxidoreductase
LEKNNLYITGLADKCTNCGNCRIICPVFKVTGEEVYSTRGRINLVKGFLNNELQPSRDLSDKLFVCLDCRQCLDLCPADVEYTEIIRHTKSRLILKNKIFAFKRSVLEGIFSYKTSSSDLYFLLLRKGRKFLFKNNIPNYFGKLILRILGFNSSVTIPEIPIKNFFKMGIRHKLKNDRGLRIALFTGCGGKHLYPDCADNFVKILRSEGIETVIPKKQVCCGNPLSYKGFLKSADKNLNINSSLFNSLLDIGNIVSLCPGAGNLFKEFNHPDYKPSFRIPVKNWIEFVFENKIEVAPKYDNSIIFHSCPKCGQADLYRDFVNYLYKDHTQIPVFTNEFCGCTELLDRSNFEMRNMITESFYDINGLEKSDFIACSSFECIEHLNHFFVNKKKSIRAIHFIDALKNKI